MQQVSVVQNWRRRIVLREPTVLARAVLSSSVKDLFLNSECANLWLSSTPQCVSLQPKLKDLHGKTDIQERHEWRPFAATQSRFDIASKAEILVEALESMSFARKDLLFSIRTIMGTLKGAKSKRRFFLNGNFTVLYGLERLWHPGIRKNRSRFSVYIPS